MNLFTITGVKIKALGKLKMAKNAVLLSTVSKLRLNNWPIVLLNFQDPSA